MEPLTVFHKTFHKFRGCFMQEDSYFPKGITSYESTGMLQFVSYFIRNDLDFE